LASARVALAGAHQARCVRVRLSREGESLFFAELPPAFRGQKIYLAPRSDLAPEALLRAFPLQSKVAPRERLQALIVSALPGIPCVPCLAPPQSLSLEGAPCLQLTEALPPESAGLGIYAPPSLAIESIDAVVPVQ
jgi:predicted component of type VI protein secretion system